MRIKFAHSKRAFNIRLKAQQCSCRIGSHTCIQFTNPEFMNNKSRDIGVSLNNKSEQDRKSNLFSYWHIASRRGEETGERVCVHWYVCTTVEVGHVAPSVSARDMFPPLLLQKKKLKTDPKRFIIIITLPMTIVHTRCLLLFISLFFLHTVLVRNDEQ